MPSESVPPRQRRNVPGGGIEHRGGAAGGVVAGGRALGSMLFVTRARAQVPTMLVVGLHATLGVAGLVMLAAYLSV